MTDKERVDMLVESIDISIKAQENIFKFSWMIPVMVIILTITVAMLTIKL